MIKTYNNNNNNNNNNYKSIKFAICFSFQFFLLLLLKTTIVHGFIGHIWVTYEWYDGYFPIQEPPLTVEDVNGLLEATSEYFLKDIQAVYPQTDQMILSTIGSYSKENAKNKTSSASAIDDFIIEKSNSRILFMLQANLSYSDYPVIPGPVAITALQYSNLEDYIMNVLWSLPDPLSGFEYSKFYWVGAVTVRNYDPHSLTTMVGRSANTFKEEEEAVVENFYENKASISLVERQELQVVGIPTDGNNPKEDHESYATKTTTTTSSIINPSSSSSSSYSGSTSTVLKATTTILMSFWTTIVVYYWQ